MAQALHLGEWTECNCEAKREHRPYRFAANSRTLTPGDGKRPKVPRACAPRQPERPRDACDRADGRAAVPDGRPYGALGTGRIRAGTALATRRDDRGGSADTRGITCQLGQAPRPADR